MKALLVIDMPKDCEHCPMRDGDLCFASGSKDSGLGFTFTEEEGFSYKAVDDQEIRPSWCPLKPQKSLDDAIPISFIENIIGQYDDWNEDIEPLLALLDKWREEND